MGLLAHFASWFICKLCHDNLKYIFAPYSFGYSRQQRPTNLPISITSFPSKIDSSSSRHSTTPGPRQLSVGPLYRQQSIDNYNCDNNVELSNNQYEVPFVYVKPTSQGGSANDNVGRQLRMPFQQQQLPLRQPSSFHQQQHLISNNNNLSSKANKQRGYLTYHDEYWIHLNFILCEDLMLLNKRTSKKKDYLTILFSWICECSSVRKMCITLRYLLIFLISLCLLKCHIVFYKIMKNTSFISF